MINLVKFVRREENPEAKIRKMLTQVVSDYLKQKFPIQKFSIRDMLNSYYAWDGGATIKKQPNKWLNIYIDLESNLLNIRVWDNQKEDYVEEYTFYDINYSPVIHVIQEIEQNDV